MSFISEKSVRATRKPHQCCGCCTMIEKGSPAVRWAGLADGDFGTAIYHPECREAEIAWNQMLGCYADDWQSLAYNREGDDDEWLVASYPVVAARLGLASPDPSPLNLGDNHE